MYIGFGNQCAFSSVYAHINLLGWVSPVLSGLIAVIHFWLQMIGVPLLTFAMVLFGLGKFEIGRILVFLGASFLQLTSLKMLR